MCQQAFIFNLEKLTRFISLGFLIFCFVHVCPINIGDKGTFKYNLKPQMGGGVLLLYVKCKKGAGILHSV